MVEYQEGNFWEVYPIYKIKEPFRTIYKKYKSTKRSSSMAWYVFLFCDSSSEFFTYPEDIRKEELDQSFPDISDVKEVQDAMKIYDDHMCSADERAFKYWTKTLLERQRFLESIHYSDLELDEVKKMDGIMIDSNRIWDAYQKIEEKYQKSKAENTIMGGGSETFLEQS